MLWYFCINFILYYYNMKTKIKIFLWGFIFLLTSMFLWAAWLHFSWTGWDKVTANVMDVVNVNTNTWTLLVLETDQISSAYAGWERLFLTGAWIMLTSEQYGDFSHNGWLKLYASWSLAACGWISYAFWWNTSLVSQYWWTVNITTWYYCPQNQQFRFELTWNTLWTIYAENTTSVANELFVFNSRKVMISWATNSKDIVSTTSEYTSPDASIEQQNNFVKVNASYEGSMLEINTTINKNLLAMTKGKLAEKTLTSLSPTFNNSFYFYDYRGTQNVTSSHQSNQWKILTLWTPNINTNKMPVTWENTLIVQWWNLYITNDIYNTDKNSILTIIVKRDEWNRRKNGWNVYIHPNVTNIDAVIIAEWSILNFNISSSPQVLTKSNASSSLRKQLLIYWAINTKNTLWDAVNSSIGTDHYENGLTWSGEIYSLGNLRTFQPMWNTGILWTNNCSITMNWSNVTAMNTNTTAEQYAFAWKRQCFRDDSWNYGLRTTEKLAPIVIEYNPLLQSKPPRILQNTY